MNNSETVYRQVEFHDTDAAGIMHFSAFFTFMEEAEHEFLRRRGLSVMLQDEEGKISWPRVSACCDFTSAVKFEDNLAIEVSVDRLGSKSITYGFRFSHDEREIAAGSITSVCCRIQDSAPPRSINIPDWFSEKITSPPLADR